MGFPNFGKVKTITLPIPHEPMSIAEYKAKYGIDLKEFLYISDDSNLYFKAIPNTRILFDISEVLKSFGSYNNATLIDLSTMFTVDNGSSAYVSGTTDGRKCYCVRSYLGEENALTPEYVIVLKLDKSKELNLDNITIVGMEY